MKTRIERSKCSCQKILMFIGSFSFLFLCASPVFSQNQVQQQIITLNQQTIPLHQLQHAITQDTLRLQAAQPQFHAPVQQVSPAMQDRPDFRNNRHIIKDTTAQVRIQVIEDNQLKEVSRSLTGFQLDEGQNIAVIRSRDIPQLVESKGKIRQESEGSKLQGMALPELYLARIRPFHDGPGIASTPSEVAVLQVLVDTMPVLRYNSQEKYYSGQFYVMLLEDSKEMLGTSELVEPISLHFSSSFAYFEPAHTLVGHTNVPTTSIRITDDSPSNPVPVKIITRFNPHGYITHLAKQALLRIDTPPRKIQGMGIQAIPVSVSLHNYLKDDTVRVHFVSTLGMVDPDTLYLTKNKAGKVTLKSEGTGAATLKANAPGFMPEEVTFEYVLPWMFVLLTLIGGIIGAVLKYLMKPEKGKFLPGIAQGFLAGLVVGLLYYLTGLDFINLNLGREYYEFAVLLLAIIGALFWEKIYDSLAKLIIR